MKKSLAAKLAVFSLLLVLPLCLRLVPIRHGLPRNYVPDTHMVRQALAMARDRDLVPQAGQYSFYPNLLPYLLLPGYAARYAAGKAAGSWSSAKEFGETMLDHPEQAAIVARLLVALFGALTPLAVFAAARAAGLRRGAWVSAWLAATSLLSVQLSTHERPWAPMTFFMVLACWPAALYARDGRMSRLVLSGVAAGLAAACHQGGLVSLAIPGLAWVLGPLEWRGRDLLARAKQGIACTAAFAAIALALGYPHFLRDGLRAAKVAGAEKLAEGGGLQIGGLSVVFDVRWESLSRLSRTFLGYEPAILALGIGGLAFGFARRELRAPLLFAVLWAAFFMTNASDHVRYLLPVAVFLCWPAGCLAERLLEHRAGAALLAVLLALPLAQAARLSWLLSRTDTRAEAEGRLAALGEGSVVAIDRYGPDVELDRASLARLERLRASVGETLRAREARRKLRLETEGAVRPEPGIDAVRLEEVLEVDERAGTSAVRRGLEGQGATASDVLDALGVTHLLLVDRRPDPATPHVLLPLLERWRPVLVIDPARGRGPPDEAFLPTEMDFPLTGLWEVARPGPWMALYDLKRE